MACDSGRAHRGATGRVKSVSVPLTSGARAVHDCPETIDGGGLVKRHAGPGHDPTRLRRSSKQVSKENANRGASNIERTDEVGRVTRWEGSRKALPRRIELLFEYHREIRRCDRDSGSRDRIVRNCRVQPARRWNAPQPNGYDALEARHNIIPRVSQDGTDPLSCGR